MLAIKRAAEIGLCVYDCPLCEGLGYVRTGKGDITLCPNVDPFKLPAYAVRTGISRQEAETLDFRSIQDRANIKTAIRAVLETIIEGSGWVYLHGDFGVGKSLILRTATATILRSGKHASYIRMVDLLDRLRDSYDDNSKEDDSEILSWYSSVPLLAIDEIDRINETPWATERRFYLMDSRYAGAVNGEHITLIASNKKPEDLPGYLADRVLDGRFAVIKITGNSARPSMQRTK